MYVVLLRTHLRAYYAGPSIPCGSAQLAQTVQTVKTARSQSAFIPIYAPLPAPPYRPSPATYPASILPLKTTTHPLPKLPICFLSIFYLSLSFYSLSLSCPSTFPACILCKHLRVHAFVPPQHALPLPLQPSLRMGARLIRYTKVGARPRHLHLALPLSSYGCRSPWTRWGGPLAY